MQGLDSNNTKDSDCSVIQASSPQVSKVGLLDGLANYGVCDYVES